MQKQTNRSTYDSIELTEEPHSSAPRLRGFSADRPNRPTGDTDGVSIASIRESTPAFEHCSADDLFDVLSNRRRRYVVYFLKHATGPAELGPLATQIAAWENDESRAEVSSIERKRVYTSLQQIHLPKMDDFGVLAFDKRSGTIEPTASLAEVTLDTDGPADESTSWAGYYLTLSALSLGLVAAIRLDLWPIVLIPDLAWMTSLVLSFLLVSTVQWHTSP